MPQATIHITGNIEPKDGELSYHPNGTPVMKFTIPVSRGKDKPTIWYSISYMSKKLDSEKFAALFKKGAIFSVVGDFQINESENGKAFYNVYAYSVNPEFSRVDKGAAGSGEDEVAF